MTATSPTGRGAAAILAGLLAAAAARATDEPPTLTSGRSLTLALVASQPSAAEVELAPGEFVRVAVKAGSFPE